MFPVVGDIAIFKFRSQRIVVLTELLHPMLTPSKYSKLSTVKERMPSNRVCNVTHKTARIAKGMAHTIKSGANAVDELEGAVSLD